MTNHDAVSKNKNRAVRIAIRQISIMRGSIKRMNELDLRLTANLIS
jgi:hypothetical protein